MTNRWRSFAGVVALAMALIPAGAVAQSPGAPRLPWGDPDLEGTWTNATLTPLQRPPELGTKAFFTARGGGCVREAAHRADQRRSALAHPVKWAPTTMRSSSAAPAA